MSLLEARNVVAGYVPGLPIVHGVSVDVDLGQVVVVLGPNGAGKSTLVKALAGVVSTFAGHVMLEGRDITSTPAHKLSAAGVGYVPQNANVFTTLSVEDNLRAGGYLLKQDLRQRVDHAFARFPDLEKHRKQPGRALSGGQRQMLAIARALMTSPRLLLLDEPSAGLSPLMVNEVFAQVRRIADSGVAVLMVEQNVRAGLRIADRGVVLVNGLVARAGTAADLAADQTLAHAYLGKLAGESAAATEGRA
ncbi:ABC transporter ATP-binding protein [Caenimonas sedimenti]|uniref:ABC transporter ATP-binding protein n=1 Tax=Caenimonas sedimenti TaxID=2596921 RepID=A0A562ZYM2_9BURK|nr:ABC transporter ATP-binding protein [Caenimonas sedimenti]TWO73334.1 ABC transporter ATP-binding protein [Caenimonas sedimenti]